MHRIQVTKGDRGALTASQTRHTAWEEVPWNQPIGQRVQLVDPSRACTDPARHGCNNIRTIEEAHDEAGDTLQFKAPDCREYDPCAHKRQLPCPSVGCDEPGRHSVQLRAPASEVAIEKDPEQTPMRRTSSNESADLLGTRGTPSCPLCWRSGLRRRCGTQLGHRSAGRNQVDTACSCGRRQSLALSPSGRPCMMRHRPQQRTGQGCRTLPTENEQLSEAHHVQVSRHSRQLACPSAD